MRVTCKAKLIKVQPHFKILSFAFVLFLKPSRSMPNLQRDNHMAYVVIILVFAVLTVLKSSFDASAAPGTRVNFSTS